MTERPSWGTVTYSEGDHHPDTDEEAMHMGFFRPAGEGPDDAASEADVDDLDATDDDPDDASVDEDDDGADPTDPSDR